MGDAKAGRLSRSGREGVQVHCRLEASPNETLRARGRVGGGAGGGEEDREVVDDGEENDVEVMERRA